MGKTIYTEELIKEILNYTEEHSYRAAEQKYGVQRSTIHRWKYPRFKEKQNERCRSYMAKKLANPAFQKLFYQKRNEKYRSDPVYRERRNRDVAQRMKDGRQNNPKYRATYMRWLRKRRAAKLSVNENYTHEDEQYTRNLFNHHCAICGSTDSLQIDHWYPISKGYALSRTNAVLLCRYCNLSKGSKLPPECYDSNIIKRITDHLSNGSNASATPNRSLPSLVNP